MTLLGAEAIDRLLEVHFPQAHHGGRVMFIETIGEEETVVRLRQAERNMRPGNTISGPAMFALADWGTYVAILARHGESALQAVTTGLHVIAACRAQDPERFAFLASSWEGRPAHFDFLAGSTALREGLSLGYDVAGMTHDWAAYEAAFCVRRAPYLLYGSG